MAGLTDFISRIFSTDQTQGLSGGAEVVTDVDPAGSFYASRLRKHRTDEDLVEAPGWLWSTVSFQGRKGGLRAHVHAERGEGVASFTDVLVVLNQSDARRAARIEGEPWTSRAACAISEKFVGYCQRERFALRFATRPLRFWFVADGGEDMLGRSFGLAPGEFITGLLPNLYAHPAPDSRPVLAVHLNLPGAWEGYREVGRLYSDQLLFTLGRHWLDTFHHPALLEPGLYRLQQLADGALVHAINPELQDRYLVRSDALEGGTSVLTIAEHSGTPVAYLVLAVVEPSVAEPMRVVDEEEVTPARAQPGPPVQAVQDRASGADSGLFRRDPQQRTIVPDAVVNRILTLHERGALLQKVHFGTFMEGYDVHIGPGGRIATQLSAPRATLQVRGNRVHLLVASEAVRVNGQPVRARDTVPLVGTVALEVDGHRLEYRDLTGVRVEGWPYLAELRRPGAGTYLDFGETFRLGRDRRCRVRLPDESHNDNIAWLPSVGSGSTIRSRTGDIPKSRFYTDSIMVASEHAELDLSGEPILRSLARHCYTFVRRDGQVLALAPSEAPNGVHALDLCPGDEVLVGNCLLQVSYPPPARSDAARPAPPAPPPAISAEQLAAAVDPSPAPSLPAPSLPGPPLPAGTPLSVSEIVRGKLGADSPSSAMRAARLRSAASLPDPNELPPLPSPSGPPASSGPTFPRAPVARPAAAPPYDPKRPPPPMLLEAFPAIALSPPPAVPVAVPVALPDALPGAPLFLETEEDDPNDPVLSVEEARWKVELSRPARLVQVGWMVSGDAIIGNHSGAQIVVPEVRAFREQAFMTLDYFFLSSRGRKGRAEVLQEGEGQLLYDGVPVTVTEELDKAELRIVRRDANLDPDFDITLRLLPDDRLPDPRARVLAVDTSTRLVAALFTLGFPLRADRRMRIGTLTGTFRFDGEALGVSEYLGSYRSRDGFKPFFVRHGDRGWQTFPEDGTRVALAPGDGLLIGNVIYRFEA